MRIIEPIATAATFFVLSISASGQANTTVAPSTFQTTSVTASKAGFVRGPVRMGPQGVAATNVTLKQLIRFAFDLHESQILGPGWIGVEGYDVTARPPNDVSVPQVRLMLRALLEDRFKLKSHRETREMPVYWLMTADGGPKLRDPKDEETFNANFAGKSPFRPGYLGIFTKKDLPGFAARLSGGINRPVVDKTGIKGEYWFQIEWADDQPGTASPSLLAALREQSGLKLEEHTSPTEVIVIESVERPSGN
jgi:uncharacterized protein (TIGR03435 family)